MLNYKYFYLHILFIYLFNYLKLECLQNLVSFNNKPICTVIV